jgi:hypothetical protein
MCGRPSIRQSLHQALLTHPVKCLPSKMVVPRWITVTPISNSPWPPTEESRTYSVAVMPSTSIKSVSSAPSTTVFGQCLQAILHFILIEASDSFPGSCCLQLAHRPQRDAFDGTYTGPRRLPSSRLSSTPEEEEEEEALLIESGASMTPPPCALLLLWICRAWRPRHSVARQLVDGAGEGRWACGELQPTNHAHTGEST